MNAIIERPPLKWSTQLSILSPESTPPLRGDKIILPPSALEQLLAAATVTVSNTSRPQNSDFDPYNPYSYAAERQAREQLVERQQQLPHPLTFRLVNPRSGRIVFAGIREFSASENEVGISTFLREALGVQTTHPLRNAGEPKKEDIVNGVHRQEEEEMLPRLTVHVQELPKGTFVKLRPLEAGYDTEDWKALLEHYLRDNYTTLTKGEVLEIPAGKAVFRFLVDGLKPNEEAITLVDTDLEVDIEPLNEEQARENLQKLAQKSMKAPGTNDGSSVGGKINVDTSVSGQVRSGEYVDYDVEYSNSSQDLDIELLSLNDENDIDLFIKPYGPKHRSRPREDNYVFADNSTRANKRVKIRHSHSELENTEALWISVRGYQTDDDVGQPQVPAQYTLRISLGSENPSSETEDDSVTDQAPLGPDEERCSNCLQAVPSRTMFLHQNFCLRNNILCPHCHLVFQKSSSTWKTHWHCPHDDSYGNTSSSKNKHDTLMHTPASCPSCHYEAANVPDLAHHRTTTCPSKLILCQFCHLQVPQQGPDDLPAISAEVVLSGLTPHELSDGARTTECHICSKIVRLRDMTTHLKHHDLQRLSRTKPRICRNVNCGRTLDGIGKGGEVRMEGARNDLGICDVCFGPLYVSAYDPDGKALKRRVERRYLTQLLTGCNQPSCRNAFCKTGRKSLDLLSEGQTISSKDALVMIKPMMDGLQDSKGGISFCTDEAGQRRRTLADMIAAEGVIDVKGKSKANATGSGGSGYEVEWCIAALEAEGGDLDRGRNWLKDYAPRRAEGRR